MAERIKKSLNKIRFYEESKTNQGFVYQLTSFSDGDQHKIQVKPSYWPPDCPPDVLNAVHRMEDYFVRVRSNPVREVVEDFWIRILVAISCT